MKIIILPGLDGTGLLHRELHDCISDKYQTTSIAYPSDLHRYNDLFDWVQSELPTDDFVLIAESFSGPLGIMIGAQNMPNLKGIIFVAAYAKRPQLMPTPLLTNLGWLSRKSRLLSNVEQPFLMGKWYKRQFTNEFNKALENVPLNTLVKRLQAVLKVNLLHQASQITVPSLHIIGSRDSLVPRRASLALKTTEVVTISGPHFLLQARPQICANQIENFCAKLDISST